RNRVRVTVFLHRRERRNVGQPDHDPRASVHAVEFHAELLTRTRAERPVPRMGRAPVDDGETLTVATFTRHLMNVTVNTPAPITPRAIEANQTRRLRVSAATA